MIMMILLVCESLEDSDSNDELNKPESDEEDVPLITDDSWCFLPNIYEDGQR